MIELFSRMVYFISSQFDFSESGSSIPGFTRSLLGKYSKPDASQFEAIGHFFATYDYLSAFETMLNSKIADCGDQAMLLGFLLQLYKQQGSLACCKTLLCLMTLESEYLEYTEEHTFIVHCSELTYQELMLPESAPESPTSIEALKGYCKKDGKILFDRDITILDPWQNLVWAHGISDISHPFIYTQRTLDPAGKISVEMTDLEFNFTEGPTQLSGSLTEFPNLATFMGRFAMICQTSTETIPNILHSKYATPDQPYGPFADYLAKS